MWPLCSANSFLWSLLPLAIGLATGWWVWATAEKMPPKSKFSFDDLPEALPGNADLMPEPVVHRAPASEAAIMPVQPSEPTATLQEPVRFEAEPIEPALTAAADIEAPRVEIPDVKAEPIELDAIPQAPVETVRVVSKVAETAGTADSTTLLVDAPRVLPVADRLREGADTEAKEPATTQVLTEENFEIAPEATDFEPSKPEFNAAPEALGLSSFSSVSSITPRHDDLTVIKGIGPKLNELLHDLGVHRYAQIASWTPEDIARIDGQLGAFKGRVEREEWMQQADLLARGELAAFELRYGEADSSGN
jgi:predicted flap endonuclease-1-like 5' DNA nuclease